MVEAVGLRVKGFAFRVSGFEKLRLGFCEVSSVRFTLGYRCFTFRTIYLQHPKP